MTDYTIGLLIWLVLLVAAIPYIKRIRHPAQQPVAAYLIFLFMFVIVSSVLYGLLGWLASILGMGPMLARTGPAIVFLLLVLLPAFFAATWLARKPPWRQPPPG